MNRKVLEGKLVSKGDMYANDALQSILCKIFSYDNYRHLQLQQMFLDKLLSKECEEELKIQSRNMNMMIYTFNTIVGHGKEFALDFIRNNYIVMGHSYRD